jgi:hypothetical protein
MLAHPAASTVIAVVAAVVGRGQHRPHRSVEPHGMGTAAAIIRGHHHRLVGRCRGDRPPRRSGDTRLVAEADHHGVDTPGVGHVHAGGSDDAWPSAQRSFVTMATRPAQRAALGSIGTSTAPAHDHDVAHAGVERVRHGAHQRGVHRRCR